VASQKSLFSKEIARQLRIPAVRTTFLEDVYDGAEQSRLLGAVPISIGYRRARSAESQGCIRAEASMVAA
jgi:hypothetical protein